MTVRAPHPDDRFKMWTVWAGPEQGDGVPMVLAWTERRTDAEIIDVALAAWLDRQAAVAGEGA